MKFGLAFANVGAGATREGALRLAREAERNGFESLWAVEHVVVPRTYRSPYPYHASGRMPGGVEADLPDPLVWLAFVAAATERIRVATGMLILPQRNPLITAKEVATLDHLSGGRTILGIGVGWLEEEFVALGIPFAERGRRTDEYVAAMRALWGEDAASITGEHVSFTECVSRPRPVQGTVPIVIGGSSAVAARRAGRIGDGFFPAGGSIEELATLFEVARVARARAGRDPADLELTAGGGGRDADAAARRIEQLGALGVGRVVLTAGDAAALGETASWLRERFDLET